MIQMTIFVLKVSRMTIEMSSGETVKMMAPSIVMVSPMKLILRIDIVITMTLTTLFVLQVRLMVMKISSGVTVKKMTSLIMKVSLRKVTQRLTSQLG